MAMFVFINLHMIYFFVCLKKLALSGPVK